LPARKKAATTKSQSTGKALATQNVSHRAPNPMRVLLLEDSEADAELIRHELRRAGMVAVTDRVDSEEAFAFALREFAPDVVLSDHSLAQFDAQAALTLLRKVRPTTALIVVTGSPHTDKTAA
jgi:CheY-like chemotaxis protein